VQSGTTGLLVPSRESCSLADAVLSLLRDPERAATLGAAARGAVYPAYSSRRLVRDVEALYLSLAGEKGLRAC